MWCPQGLWKSSDLFPESTEAHMHVPSCVRNQERHKTDLCTRISTYSYTQIILGRICTKKFTPISSMVEILMIFLFSPLGPIPNHLPLSSLLSSLPSSLSLPLFLFPLFAYPLLSTITTYYFYIKNKKSGFLTKLFLF